MLFRQEKSGSKKVQKIELFQRGLSMVFGKKWSFCFSVGGIWANPARKDRLLKFWIQKNGF